MLDHLRKHSGHKPFVCKLCEKGFKQKAQLYRHRKIHKDSIGEGLQSSSTTTLQVVDFQDTPVTPKVNGSQDTEKPTLKVRIFEKEQLFCIETQPTQFTDVIRKDPEDEFSYRNVEL
mmetsp:Transcript_24329/g.18503  ORF Transcript_24329/g.18503 Transcript_24329/m.18503 type:complete len:117 (+) Transcript_24329:257-607(+)